MQFKNQKYDLKTLHKENVIFQSRLFWTTQKNIWQNLAGLACKHNIVIISDANSISYPGHYS